MEGLVRLLALPAMMRAAKTSAVDTAQRAALGAAAGLAGLVGLFCFTNASLTLLERYMDSAEAWSLVGGFYAVVAGLLYFAAIRRRRG
jgi:sugar phosphate permease